jgi:hypothetical protein
MVVPVCTAATEALADATEALSVSNFAFSEAPGPRRVLGEIGKLSLLWKFF